jgi:sugar phosphate isomerase/epimerase
MPDVLFSVFTKPWQKQPLTDVCALVHDMGFDAVELTVRPGYQVTPETMTKGLPEAVKIFADNGVRITSLAVEPDERTIAAAAENNVRLLRENARSTKEGYLATEAKMQREYDALVPLLDKYKVTLGVQNHSGPFVANNASGLRALIGKYDPKHVGAVLDFGHCALQGENPENAVDIIWSRLVMVNFKNAIWRATTPPDAEYQKWISNWVAGNKGLANWPLAMSILKKRGYKGVITLTAEYTDKQAVDELVRGDCHWARAVWEKA